VTEVELLILLKKQDKAAQKWLYDRYARLFFHVCRRYLNRREEAEEALLNGFFKAMTHIDSFQGGGSFEGWMRRIMVNESLMMLRTKQHIHFPVDEMQLENLPDDFSIDAELSAQEILALLEQLPVGCRTVFNLFVLEGMKHHEIAEMLQISINTSKSQLILARQKLSALLEKNLKITPIR
jgi:RNA polymerase sigma factor (sigma-70 family)